MTQFTPPGNVYFLKDKHGKLRQEVSPERFPLAVSVFESLRVYEGVIFQLEDHLDRLFRSATSVGLRVPASQNALRAFLLRSVRESGRKEAYLRLTVMEDCVFAFVGPARSYSENLYKQGVSIQISAVRRSRSNSLIPEAKSYSYLNAVLARLEHPKDHEVIYLNEAGYVTEGLISNLFMAKSGKLLTAPAVGILDGLTRRFVIKWARSNRVDVRETWFSRHDLYNADEVFLTVTSAGIIPVREVDSRKINGVIPGPLTKRVSEAYRKAVRREIRKGYAL